MKEQQSKIYLWILRIIKIIFGGILKIILSL